MSGIRVCITDDHQLFRKLMGSLLKGFARVDPDVFEAENGKVLISLLETTRIDVVLLDLAMPVMGGEEAAIQIIRDFPAVRIIVLTMHDSERHVLHLMDIGVHGFLLKNCDPEEIERAVYAVIDRDFYRNDLATKALIQLGLERNRNHSVNRNLTERERDILKLICEELTMKQIGYQLGISERTVENHRMHVMNKLGVKSVVGLVRYAYESGMLK
jgi:DNA-binding NarL/FixJ family response regulator